MASHGMSEGINWSMESDLFDHLNYFDSTSSVVDILVFAHALDENLGLIRTSLTPLLNDVFLYL